VNTDTKKLLLIFGGGLILFWAFMKMKPIGIAKSGKKSDKKKSKDEISPEQKKNAVIMKKAYMDAMTAGESKQFLEDMNKEFFMNYSMKIMTDKGSGKLIVTDSEGDKVI
jgi:hypothetical protein